MRTLLKSVIIPKIEYASVIWSPTNATLINTIENIQRRYTSRIADYQTYDPVLQMPICTTNYWDRLKDLKLFSLERRRERFAILYVYRFIIGIIHLDCFKVFVERGIKVQRRINSSSPKHIKSLRQNSFFYRGPQLYNLLPLTLRQVEEIDTPKKQHVATFKEKLDKYLAEIPDQPTTPGLHRAAETNSLIHQIPLTEWQRR